MITSASLSMFLSQQQGAAQPVSLSAALADWGEGASNAGDPGGGGTQAQTGDATWLHRFYNTIFWTTPGGDFSATPSASTVVSTANTTYNWSGSGLVADVQTWVSNPSINFGWIIRGNEVTSGQTQRFNSRHSANSPQLTIVYQVPCASPTPTETPTPTSTPTPTETPTPTPTATLTPSPTPVITISGAVRYCTTATLNPVPGVTLALTGDATGSTVSDAAGNYAFSSLAAGGNYTVTPSKVGRTPGSDGINTVDVIAIQRHFLNLGTPLTGCRLTAADVNGVGGVDTVDVIATQRFFLGLSTGIGNVGKYRFSPTNRSYPGVVTDQTAQNYDALIFGDISAAFVH